MSSGGRVRKCAREGSEGATYQVEEATYIFCGAGESGELTSRRVLT